MAQPAPTPTPSGGRPLGKPRGWVVVFFLGLITLGIYWFVWTYKTFQEMKDYSGEGIGGGAGPLLSPFVNCGDRFLLPAGGGRPHGSRGGGTRGGGAAGGYRRHRPVEPPADRRLVHLAGKDAERVERVLGGTRRGQDVTTAR